MSKNGKVETMTKLIPVCIHIKKVAGKTTHNILARYNPFHYLVTPSGHLDNRIKSGRPLLASELRKFKASLGSLLQLGGIPLLVMRTIRHR